MMFDLLCGILALCAFYIVFMILFDKYIPDEARGEE